jgi:hypothetical protein
LGFGKDGSCGYSGIIPLVSTRYRVPALLSLPLAVLLAVGALVTLVCGLRGDDARAWFGPDAPVRLAGAIALLLGGAYFALWLSEIVPALASGAVPKSAAEIGFVTNPIHVLDLGIVLPAFVVGGAALLRHEPLGYWLAPTMLAFGAVIDVALLGMGLSIRARGTGAAPPFAGLLVVLVLSVGALAALLRRLRPAPDSRSLRPTEPAPQGRLRLKRAWL